MVESTYKVRTPLFPLYSEVCQLLNILNGVPKKSVTQMIYAIRDQTGTPQNPVDWSDPDTWISERLSDEDADLARKIWAGSDYTVNPRHIYGAYLFINNYNLLIPDQEGIYQLEKRGQAFLNDDASLLKELDDAEGLPQLLGILATKTQAKRGDLLSEWGEFLREYSKFGTPSTIKDTLHRRLANLIERGFVNREGNIYTITQAGINYATPLSKIATDPGRNVLKTINTYNQKQRKALHQQLAEMSPYQFEHLIRDLLEAMGYEAVTVTKEAGDKGVDVVGTVQFGITTITEVVQVKRHRANIGRPVLDQLRGALPYHKAIRGTLITLGNFSKGCKEAALFPGAAPITLINGEKLLDLLIEHEIGLRKRPVQLYELDEDLFRADDEAAIVE
jgi:restriction system protein